MSTAGVHRGENMRDRTCKMIAVLMAIIVATTVTALSKIAAAAGPFKDVNGVLAPEVELAWRAGLVTGYPDGTFRPNERVSRAAFAKMIVVAVEASTGTKLPTGDEPFSDVQANQALYSYVVKAYHAGYIRGYPDGTFGYDTAITRAQAAAILQRALDLPLAPAPFRDVQPASVFAEAIGAVAFAGIMHGDGSAFHPDRVLSRAEAAAVAYRAFEYLISASQVQPVEPWPTEPPSTPPATSPPIGISLPDEIFVVGSDGQFLGVLTSNRYASDSICNPYGRYGSEYSSTSIWNRYGPYGSPYSSKSAFNDYASSPPILVTGDGTIVGYLTTNPYKPGGISPYGICERLERIGP